MCKIIFLANILNFALCFQISISHRPNFKLKSELSDHYRLSQNWIFFLQCANDKRNVIIKQVLMAKSNLMNGCGEFGKEPKTPKGE